jgi:hypothetical protein
MINYPTKPEKLFTIEEIAAQIQSGEYSAELLLMHLCFHYDKQSAALNNLQSVHSTAMERWRDESPVRVDFAGKIDGGDMTLNLLSVELDFPYSVEGLRIGEKVTISRYFD